MAKSNYLPRILLAVVICICGCVGSDSIVVGCRLLVVSNNEVQKKFCNPRADQRTKNKESGRAGLSMHNQIRNLQPITYNLQLHYRLPAVSKNLVQKKFCIPHADQRAKNKESGRAGLSMNNQIKNLQPITYNLQLHYRLPAVSKNLVQKKFCIPHADQRAKNKESGRAGLSMANRIKNLQPITYNLQLHLTTKKIYDSQIGIREQGVNSGPQVEDYLRYVNLGSGQPWCAAFICWVYGHAGIENPRSGWSPDLFKGSKVIWDRAESVKLKVESREKHKDGNSLGAMSVRPTTNNQQPTTADIFGLFFPEKNRIAHTGFIDLWDGTWLITVEGNTNVSGGREGDGVYRKRRLVKSVYQVARYIGVPYN